LIIDYSRTIQEMINAGNYDWANSEIIRNNFSLPTELSGKKVSVPTKLFYFKYSMDSLNVINEMNEAGHRPATLAELLALGEIQPELQKQFQIIALNSITSHLVPVLSFYNSERIINLGWFGNGWQKKSRFLGVCK